MWCKTWKIFLLTCLVALATLPSSVNADIGLAPAIVVLSMAVLVIVVLGRNSIATENNSENDSEILPKSYIKKFKNLKFRHVQKLGRILRIILRIAIELTPWKVLRYELRRRYTYSTACCVARVFICS